MKKTTILLLVSGLLVGCGSAQTPKLSSVPQSTPLKHEDNKDVVEELEADRERAQARREEFLKKNNNELLDQP